MYSVYTLNVPIYSQWPYVSLLTIAIHGPTQHGTTGLMCHFLQLKEEPYIVFPDLLVALCVYLYNIYTLMSPYIPSGLMCHFRQLPCMD